jgi:hypothetical protein
MSTKDTYSSVFLKAAETNNIIEDVKSKWWYNLRSKDEGGLRLTDEGLLFLKEEAKIKTYEVKIPKEIKITPQVLIWLDRYINSPWHLEKHTITVISEKSAFELYLFSGDVRKMGQAKAMSKRFQEEIKSESNH